MVVGLLTTSYPRAPGDFAGAFVADRVAVLTAAGHTVEVIAAGADASPAAPPTSGATVTRLPARFGDGPDLFGGAGAPEALERGGMGAWLGALRFSAALAAVAANGAHRWQAIESHWLVPCALAALAGAPRLRHRAYAHSGDVALLERLPLGRTLARLLATSGAELVFVTDALRRRFARLAGQSCGAVDRLEVPVALFAPAPRPDADVRRALGLAGPTVVSVGRLVPIKGYDLLVRGCARAGAGGRPVGLVLVGDGPERARLRALAARLEVPLILTGQVPRPQVAGWLRAGDLYAQPSRVLPGGRTEGLPLATLEALAVGLPVVASDSGGLAELAAREPRVTLFPSGDAAALAQRLREGLSPVM